MKKILFVALAVVSISQAVNARTGSILVGDSIDIGSTKSASAPNDVKTSTFSFSPL